MHNIAFKTDINDNSPGGIYAINKSQLDRIAT